MKHPALEHLLRHVYKFHDWYLIDCAVSHDGSRGFPEIVDGPDRGNMICSLHLVPPNEGSDLGEGLRERAGVRLILRAVVSFKCDVDNAELEIGTIEYRDRESISQLDIFGDGVFIVEWSGRCDIEYFALPAEGQPMPWWYVDLG